MTPYSSKYGNYEVKCKPVKGACTVKNENAEDQQLLRRKSTLSSIDGKFMGVACIVVILFLSLIFFSSTVWFSLLLILTRNHQCKDHRRYFGEELLGTNQIDDRIQEATVNFKIITESQKKLIWKGATRIIESNFWPCTVFQVWYYHHPRLNDFNHFLVLTSI